MLIGVWMGAFWSPTTMKTHLRRKEELVARWQGQQKAVERERILRSVWMAGKMAALIAAADFVWPALRAMCIFCSIWRKAVKNCELRDIRSRRRRKKKSHLILTTLRKCQQEDQILSSLRKTLGKSLSLNIECLAEAPVWGCPVRRTCTR